MKPEFILINWSKGEVIGWGTEAECRAQLEKATSADSYLLAEVRVLSRMLRTES